jgi:eukaryotic-like serine/threonine-protein kinase
LLQVISNEPVPPRQLQPTTPRDLETISLKCLQKSPAKRYRSAQDLAEDLHRFLAGEPIAARPVGRLERAYLWCRRNRSAAGLMLSLFLGIAVACLLAMNAERHAQKSLHDKNLADTATRQARIETKRAEDEKERAEEAKRIRRLSNAWPS